MECVIFIGIQASGKSTFYKQRFFNSHMRINLDMLRTRHRENMYVATSLEAKQPFVIDNTNPTAEERQKYIMLAKAHQFAVAGYFFEPDYEASSARNDTRTGKERVSEVGIRSTLKKLEIPSFTEGFDKLYVVKAVSGSFEVTELAAE